MKKSIFLIIAIASIAAVKAQSNVLKATPLGLTFGISNVGYEFAIANKRSITISGTYFKETEYQDIAKITGFGANIGYNFYLSSEKTVLKGLHAGPGIGVFILSNSSDNLTAFSLNASAGHQWIVWKHFAIDLFAQYDYLTKTSLPGVESSNIGIGLSLGYAW